MDTVRTTATQNDHFRRSQRQHAVNNPVTRAIGRGVSRPTFAPAPGSIFLPLIASAQTPEFEITKVTRNLIPTPQFAYVRRGTMTSFLHRKEGETTGLRGHG